MAGVCAKFNKNINLILKKFYPEIKEMGDKLEIRSILKFYFDLIDKLTIFIRDIENFQKIDVEYYKTLMDFIEDKKNLISGKYRYICRQELTAFYDKNSRENLEKIIAAKFERRNREFFTFGSLEEEIKKIAKVAGAEKVEIKKINDQKYRNLLPMAQSLIIYSEKSGDKDNSKKIGQELKKYLESKGYHIKLIENSLVTDAKLLDDSN